MALALAASGTAAGPAAASPAGFVVADGASFALSTGAGSEPWTPIGYNQYRLTGRPGGYLCDNGYGSIDDGELGAWMDGARASGANVVRTWFFQSMYDPDGSGPGAGSWAAFDRVLDAARARGMRVIPVLVNHWGDCEPSAEKTLSFYADGYRNAGYGYSQSYKQYATAVARRYSNDPAVAFWQLANEAEASGPDGCNEAAAASALRGFAADMAGALRAVDPNHLISLGTMGSGQCGTAGDDYRRVHEPVDIAEYHDYDFEGSSADDADNPMPGDQWNGLGVRLQQSGPSGLNKPFFIGESGIAADVNDAGDRTGTITAATLRSRARLIAAKLDAQMAAGADGFLVWERIAEPSDSAFNRGPRGPYGVGPGDPIEDVLRARGGAGAPIGGGWAPAGGPYAEAVLATEGLEAYWRLGEPQGMTTAVASAGDVEGSYHHGVARDAGLIAADPDAAARFSSKARGAVDFGDVADFAGRRPFSLEAWLRPAKASGKRLGGPVISKLQRHWGGYSLGTAARGRLEFTLSRGKRTSVVRGPRLGAGAAHHVAATFDGRVARLFVDGRSVASRRVGARLVDNAAPLLVGAADGRTFTGTIDEVAVYDAALSAADAAAHAAAGRAASTP